MRSRLQLLLLKLVDLPLNPHPLAMGPPRQPRKYLAYLAKQRDRRRKVRLESARAKARRILKDEFAQERRTADAARTFPWEPPRDPKRGKARLEKRMQIVGRIAQNASHGGKSIPWEGL